LINGKLFRELPDDKNMTLLEELQLSGAFKELIIKTIKQYTRSAASSAILEEESNQHDPLHERKMAERTPTGGIKIASSGDTTPEYNAVRKSYGEINHVIIRDDFVSRAHSCGLIPTRNPSSPPLDVVLNEISRDPVNYYSLQHVIATLNVENRFDKGISMMEKMFQCKDNVMS
jgi:hypothetical protein